MMGNAHTKIICFVAALVVTVSGFSTRASEPMLHDSIHLRFGVGLVSAGGNIDNQTMAFSGPGLLDGVQVGGCPTKNLTVFFEADSFTLFGNTTGTKGTDPTRDVNYGFLAGAGVGYYFERADLYLSGAVGASLKNVHVSDEGTEFNAKRDAGIGCSVMLGRDWWVSDEWSVGVSGQFMYLANKGYASRAFSSHTVAFGLLMTATFS
jgi:hypothetical protein